MELRVKYVSGPELKQEREGRALTQVEAAAQVGVSVRTWQLWENGGEVVPRPKHRRRLADWLAAGEVAA